MSSNNKVTQSNTRPSASKSAGLIWSELKKVTWPTKQETTQTTLGVIFVVIIVGILLWLFDMLLGWAIGTLYGVA